MAVGDVCGSNRGNEGYGMGLVRNASFGRKRVFLSSFGIGFEDDDNECSIPTTSKRRCLELDSFLCQEKSSLEDLPQEILIRILCGVEHDDLKILFFVSKAIREATLVAKKSHFAYSTPRKTVGFRYVDDFGDFDENETPNAPKQSRVRRVRLSAKKLNDISVSLFASDSEEDWQRKDLSMEIE